MVELWSEWGGGRDPLCKWVVQRETEQSRQMS